MTSRSVWVDLVTSMYFSGMENVSSFGTWRWTRGSLWWRQMKSPWTNHKSAQASASSVDSVGCNSSGSPWSSPLRSSLPTSCSRLRVVSRNSWSLPDIFFAVPSAGNMNSSSFFVILILLSRSFFEDKSLMRPTFPNLPNPQSDFLLSYFLRRSIHAQERNQVTLSCQIDEVLMDLALKSDDIQPLL